MKRKLISFDAFRKIEESSFTNAENELIQAEEVLAKTLGVEQPIVTGKQIGRAHV